MTCVYCTVEEDVSSIKTTLSCIQKKKNFLFCVGTRMT